MQGFSTPLHKQIIDEKTRVMAVAEDLTPSLLEELAAEVVIDALPYADRDFEAPGARENAEQLVEAEKRVYPFNAAKYSVAPPPVTAPDEAYIMYPTEMSRLNDLSTEKKKLSSVLQARATSLSEDQKAKIVVRLAEIEDNMAHSASFDSARYQPNPPGKGKTSEPEEWRAAVDNASAQVANQGHRMDVLELVGTYSTRAWKKHLLDLERLEIEAKRTLKKVRDQVQEVNWQRKTDHTAAGSDIWNLQTKWGVLVSKNYDIERLNQALVDEITVLQQQECG